MTYPNHPGSAAGSDTSRAAANLIAGNAQALRDLALAAIKERPQTSWQLAKTLQVPFESVQPRTSELRKQGLIVDSGRRGPSRSLRLKAIIWAAVTDAPPVVN